MDYDLTRVDYILCGITFPDTLKILPAASTSGNVKLQKFAIGDKNGVLQCITIKNEEPAVEFKTLPGKPITSVQLASAAGINTDRLYAASGNEVKGYTRRGKVFFTIETTLSETITSMSIVGGDLVLGSGRTVLHYRDGKEYNTYTCDDRVLDINAFTIPNSTRLRLIILTANKNIVLFEGHEQVAKLSINSGPTKLFVPPSLGPHFDCIFYGSTDGSIGIINYDGKTLKCNCLVEGHSLGPVMCLGWYTNESGPHIAVGRHDGSIQLYSIDPENLNFAPRLKFTYFCGEPITSVVGGNISSEESELLASTFSGRIFGLRTNRMTSLNNSLTNISQDALTLRRSKLEAEIMRLEKQAVIEREKYQKTTRSINTTGVSVPPLLDFQCELSGATENGWQEIRVMIAVPLDMLFVYCKQNLEIETDSAAVLSICPSQRTHNDLLATVRCQAGTRRLWIRVRHPIKMHPQMHSTKLQIYALPASAPRVARSVTVRLPFLPYYCQQEELTLIENDVERCWSELNVTGNFSVAELTSWLSEALPGELPRPTSMVEFARSHTLLKTVLLCRYQKRLAKFKCENISTLAAIRDLLSHRSIEKGLRMDMNCDIPKNFLLKQFGKIEDLFKSEYEKHKDFRLLKGLECLDLDLNTLDSEDPIICHEYKRVSKLINNTNEFKFKDIVEIIENWFEKWSTLTMQSNHEFQTEKAKLSAALNTCDLDELHKILLK